MPLTQEMRAKICRLADARGLVGTITNADAIAIRRELGLSPNRHSAVMLVLQQRIGCGPPNKDGVYVLSRFPVGYAPTPEIQVINNVCIGCIFYGLKHDHWFVVRVF